MSHKKECTPPTEEQHREQYSRTAFARMGIPFERAMQSKVVREMVEGAARAATRASHKEAVGN